MKIVHFYAENFKRLKAVEIAPDGDVVVIAGPNGAGKSAILDAIWVALAGRAKAPPVPVRKGEEKATIRLDLGEMVITRTFTEKEGQPFTDTVKVENSDGLRYPRAQAVLDDLMGAIGFDPFAFVQMKPDAQADTLMQLVPLPIDLEESALLDSSDYAKRRDINREVEQLAGQIAGIPEDKELPAEAPDRSALADQLAKAADHNTAVQREHVFRDEKASVVEITLNQAEMARQSAERLRREAAEQDELALARDGEAKELKEALEALPPIPEPINTEAIREQLREADGISGRIADQARRKALIAQRAEKQAAADKLTAALDEREKARREALAGAAMPIDGLAFGLSEKGKPVVLFGGVPFEQASTAEQLKAATAIAMASNPELRVLRIKDGSLLDEDSIRLLREMASAEDFQLWIEMVRPGESSGIIIEDGAVKGAPPPAEEPEAKPQTSKPKAKSADKPEGAMI